MNVKERPDYDIILKGSVAVSKVLNALLGDTDQERVKFKASPHELGQLLYHHCKDYVGADELYFFYGQAGGEWKIRARASKAIKRIQRILGEAVVRDMFEAVEKEHDAKIRESLCSKGLAIYEELQEGQASISEWHDYVHTHSL